MIFSVVIPTCNRNDLLRKCLASLAPAVQVMDAADYEVIVTDDSKANLAEQLIKEEFNWAKWVSGPKKGPAANRNEGAKQAAAEWIVFIDDDCIAGKDVLNSYKTALKDHPDKLAFEGSIVPDDWKLMKKEMAECPINIDGKYFWSANICVQKQLFFDIRGFDELFPLPALEDQDIFERLKLHTAIPFLKDCIVVHPVRFGSLKKKITGMKMQFRNWIYYLKKNSTLKIRAHLLKAIRDYLRQSVRDLFSLRFKLFVLHLLNFFYCLYLVVKYRNE